MSLEKTHVYGYHKEHGNLFGFAGFEMPLWYTGPAAEHMVVRDSAGIFDVTHMGRSLVRGREAEAFLDYVLSRNPSSLAQWQGQYAVMCNERGGIKDDLTVFRLGPDEFLAIYNASNRNKDYDWLHEQSKKFHVRLMDVSNDVAMFAVQGPKAQATLQKLTKTDLSQIRRYWMQFIDYHGLRVSATRSGYTGEDGFEVHVWDTPLNKPENAQQVWNDILEAGKEHGIQPCGLAARDTLRLEAGMTLYGNDIDEDTTPLEAGLSFAVRFEKPRFIGREALAQQKEKGLTRTRIGLRLTGRGIPRKGFAITQDGKKIGEVTSGTLSPLLGQGIAMAYVPPTQSALKTKFGVDIRGREVEAEVCSMPFYDQDRYGWRRKQYV
jgi:aminomethyltransferase